MSNSDAKTFGVPEEERRRYIKVDDAKANMSISGGKAKWMHLQSVSLNNGNSEYPSGDSVQVAVKWTPPDVLDGLDQNDIRAMLEAIGTGDDDGEPFAFCKSGPTGKRWAGNALVNEFGRSKEQAAAFLKTAKDRGWISIKPYHSKITRKSRQGVVLHPANFPPDGIADLE
jgi:hypothetical protein